MKTIKTNNSLVVLKQIIKITSILCFMSLFIYAYAQDNELLQVRDQVVNALQNEDENKIKQSIKIMQELIDKKYTPQRASYLGALTAKMATFSFFPWSKISYADDGSELLDKAIKKAPNDVEVRLNRASTYVNFPAMLKKDVILQNDIRWILQALKNKKIKQSAKDSTYKVLAMFFAKLQDNEKYNKYLNKIKNKKYKEAVLKFAKKQ